MASYLDSVHNVFLSQLSSFSKSILLTALKQLANGTLTVHIDERDSEDKPETVVFGSGKPEAEITVRSKNVWTRFVVNLDLVRTSNLLWILEKGLSTLFMGTGTDRGLNQDESTATRLIDIRIGLRRSIYVA